MQKSFKEIIRELNKASFEDDAGYGRYAGRLVTLDDAIEIVESVSKKTDKEAVENYLRHRK